MLVILSNFSLLISVLALVLVAICLWQVISFNRLRKTFFAGNKALDLESVILKLEQELYSGQQRQAILEDELTNLRNRLGFAVQKVGLVRFNPFDDGGGNFSFTLAVLDEHNNGVVLTSMHGRQQNRIYTKRIESGKSDAQLTQEEMQAVSQANSRQESSAKKIRSK